MNIKLNSEKTLQKQGFTLLELVIVIAILAVIGGAALVSYDGLDQKAAKSQATFNLAAIDKGVRLFKVVGGDYPSNLDLLTLSDTTVGDVTGEEAVAATAGGFFSRITRELEGADNNKATSDGSMHFFKATATIADSFAEAGIETLRGIAAASDTATAFDIANRAFDDPNFGVGTSVAMAADVVLPIIKSKNLGAADSSLLENITGLDSDTTHIVVALGLGNNATIVSDNIGVNSASFSEAPFYSDVASTEYGRFILLFHVASDANANDTIEDGEVFSSVRFVGALDAEGNWLDQEFSDSVGTKS